MVSASSSSDEQESEPELSKKMKNKKSITPSTKPNKSTTIKPSRPERPESALTPTELAAESSTVPNVEEPAIKQEIVETLRPLTPSPTDAPPSSPPPPPPPPLPPPPPPCLTQDTHTCFFTLLREVLTNNDCPASLKQTSDAVVVWSTSPISPLNEWYF